MLTTDTSNAQSTGTLDQIQWQLPTGGTEGHTTPALQSMTDDFTPHHEAMAVIALSAVQRKQFTRTERSSRRIKQALGTFCVLSALLSLAAIVVAAANTATAPDPTPALLDFFQNRW